MKIAVDAFGGDNAPRAVIEGCVAALNTYKDITIALCGDEESIKKELSSLTYDSSRVEIHHAPEVIGCDEQPTFAIRRKKNSSLVRAMELARDKEAECVVSAGSTGAVLAGATFIVRRIDGVKRPALGVVFPAEKGCVMVMDCGANVDCKPSYLMQFAVMASAYMKDVMVADNPRIGLLNNGAEAEKGNELTKAAYKLLETAPINFAGNCEARDILTGEFDAVICDGFAGNVVLKHTEGMASTLISMLKAELMADTRSKIGALLSKPAFRRFKKVMDYTEYGGAPLLGIDGGVIKAHGSSNAKAFTAAIGQARRLALCGINESIRSAIGQLPDIQD